MQLIRIDKFTARPALTISELSFDKSPRRRLCYAPCQGPPQGFAVNLQPCSQVVKFGFVTLGSFRPLQRYREQQAMARVKIGWHRSPSTPCHAGPPSTLGNRGSVRRVASCAGPLGLRTGTPPPRRAPSGLPTWTIGRQSSLLAWGIPPITNTRLWCWWHSEPSTFNGGLSPTWTQ